MLCHAKRILDRQQQYFRYAELIKIPGCEQGSNDKIWRKVYCDAGQLTVVEGNAFMQTQTLVEFPSYQDAIDCYNSPEYTEAAKIRHAAAEGAMIIVEGYDGPQGIDF